MYTTLLFWAFQILCGRLFQNMIFGEHLALEPNFP